MNIFWAAVILFTILAFGAMLSTSLLMNWCLKAFVGKKHRWLEDIIETEQCPGKWVQSKEPLVHIHLIDRSKIGYCIRKLAKLSDYVRQTKFVQDMDTRTYILNRLNEIRIKWEDAHHGFRSEAAEETKV